MENSAEASAHCHISSDITNNCYHQRSSEKFVLHLIYNVFIAPFYTVLATCGVFSFYLAAAFFFGFFAFKWVHHWCVYSALTISYDYEMHLSIAVSAVICALFSTFLASTDKLVIGSSTALIATIGGLLTMRLEKGPELGLAIGTVLSVFIYWFYLEREQQTVKDIVANNYLKISFLSERKTAKSYLNKK